MTRYKDAEDGKRNELYCCTLKSTVCFISSNERALGGRRDHSLPVVWSIFVHTVVDG